MQKFTQYSLFIALLCFTCLFTKTLQAEFDPELLSQSTVKVLIKNKQGIIGAATGFLWRTNQQVVTSLHVLSSDPASKIIVEFGKKKRRATIKAVLLKADLVLLKINKPVTGWQPLNSFNGEKPKYKSEVSALGFNQGALGLSTRLLRKGYVKPEILQVLLPPKALKILSNSNVLDVKLPIYYLDGSLLPGYSGSPVVDAQGALIGIGDGGLENGAASVSWVIPASNLALLEQSEISTLTDSYFTISEVFTGEQLVRGQKISAIDILNSLDQPGSFWSLLGSSLINSAIAAPFEPEQLFDSYELPEFIKVEYQDFTFVKSKSRTYAQMLNTSATPAGIEQVLSLLNQLFYDYHVDYQQFVFDIYEDDRSGLNIAVPQDVKLTVDDGFLLAKGQMFCRTCDYEIQYHARRLNDKTQQAIEKKPYQFLHGVADQHQQDLNSEGDYAEYDNFRSIEEFGAFRYILRAAFSDFAEPFRDKFELNYFTAATNRAAWFQAQGILNRFDQAFFQSVEQNRGTDCQHTGLSVEKVGICQDIEIMYKIMISVHLTSFSNKFFIYP